MASTAGRRWLCLALLAAGGCRIHTDFGDTEFLCSAAQPECPEGRVCVADRCVPPGGSDGGGDGDGPLGVCELAALADDNDACSQVIDISGAALAAGGTTVYGDTTGYAGDLSPSTLPGCTGSPEQGPDAIYRIDALAGDLLAATMTPEGWNGAIYLLDGCSTTAACRGGSDVPAAGIEEADIAITAADTYYLVVDGNVAAEFGCYTLHVELVR